MKKKLHFFLVNLNSFKNGRIILILNGKNAGKKGIVIENSSFSKNLFSNHVIILGMKNTPKKIKSKRIPACNLKKSRIKIFFKIMNKNHILPTRYFVDLTTEQQNLISKVSDDLLSLKSKKGNAIENIENLRWQVNNIFVDKYFSGKNKWFFKKLNF